MFLKGELVHWRKDIPFKHPFLEKKKSASIRTGKSGGAWDLVLDKPIQYFDGGEEYFICKR